MPAQRNAKFFSSKMDVNLRNALNFSDMGGNFQLAPKTPFLRPFCAFLHPKCRFRVSFHPFPAQNREIGFSRFDGIFTHKFACFGSQVRIFRILPLCSAASQMQKNTGAKRKNNVKIFTNHTFYRYVWRGQNHSLAREKVRPREGKNPTT